MYLGKIQILTRRRSRRNIATKPNCLAQLRSLLTSGLPKTRVIPLMDGPQTWSQLNDRWRHRNHLVVANVVASVLFQENLRFCHSDLQRKTEKPSANCCIRSATLGQCSDAVAHLHDKQYQRWSFHLTSTGPQNQSSWNDPTMPSSNIQQIPPIPFFCRGGVDLELCAFDFSIYIYM